jgi:hypothetical protein
MIDYSDFKPISEPHVVIDGQLVPADAEALHVLAVNAMALAVGMPSEAPSTVTEDEPSAELVGA